MKYNIPGHDPFEINTIILDLNGTLSVGGNIVEGVKGRLDKIKELGFAVVFFTGNTRNDANELSAELSIDWRLASTAGAKRDLAREMDPNTCASIGNGLIDLELTREVRLGIVVTGQAEGYAVPTLQVADIGIPTINDALDLFIDSKILTATLRQ